MPQPVQTTYSYITSHYLEYPLIAIALMSILIPVLTPALQKDRYSFKNASALLTPTPAGLQKNISFDTKQQSYEFTPPANEQTQPNSQGVGGIKYSASLASDAQNGISLTDTANKLSISLTPQFETASAKQIDGHIVYPVAGADSQLIYTFKTNGLKEDIVLYSSPANEASYQYKLSLPTGLEAKQLKDGSIGIFGGDNSLYGNISYGNDKDRALVDKARAKSAKTQLLYTIPAPTIKERDGKARATASFHYDNKTQLLTIQAQNLRQSSYPLTIDPSLALVNGSDWTAGNSDTDNIDYSNPSQISRAGLTGGSLSSWATGTVASGAISILYNGFKYDVGIGHASYTPIGTDGAGFSTATITGTNYPNYATQVNDFVEYNGYIYAIGGVNQYVNNAPCGGTLQPACTYGYTTTTTVQYSKIQTNGSLSAWQSTSSTVANHFLGGVVANNGYLYAFNGYTPEGSTNNTTQFVKINADGTLGTWASSSSLTPGNGLFANNSISVYNGYVYVTGGQTSSGLAAVATAFYAPLSSSGIGAWQATSSMVLATMDSAAVAYRGYIYVAGGCTGTGGSGCTNNSQLLSAVQYAPILANGQLGSWSYTTNLSGANGRDHPSLVAYNSYLYISAGYYCTGTSGACYNSLNYYNDFQFAKISAAGSVKPFTSGTVLPQARQNVASAAYNGYLYVIGGTDGTTFYDTVLYAPLNADGSIGSWTASTHKLSSGRYSATATIYGNKLYVLGGFTLLGAALTDTAYATIGSGGDLSMDFTTSSNTFTTGRYGAASAAVGGYLYIMGGKDVTNAVLSSTQYSLLAADGTPGVFAVTSGITSRWYLSATAAGGYIYAAGGATCSGGTTCNTPQLEYAKPNSDGTIPASGVGSWTNTTSLLCGGGCLTPGLVADRGKLYAIGFSITATVDMADVNADGTVGAWTTVQTFATGRYGQGYAIQNGYAYIMGGTDNSNPRNLTDYAFINNGGSGASNAYSAANSFTTGRYGHTSVAYNGYLYVMGGCSHYGASNCDTFLNDVQYAPINVNGTLGTWATTTSFATARFAHTSVAYNGYLYVMGGCSHVTIVGVCDGYQNDVQYGKLTSTGAVASDSGCGTAWCTTTAFPNVRHWHTSIVNSGYVYIIGGQNGVFLGDVQYGKLTSTGAVASDSGCGTAWCAATSLPAARTELASVVYNGHLYILGGATPGGYQNSVLISTINADGSLGSWSTTTSFVTPRLWAALVAYNGFMYLSGGSAGTNNYMNDVQYAPINTNGTLGTWNTTTSFTNTRLAHTSVAYNGSLYIIGGASTIFYNDVQFASLQTISRTARYSQLFKTDKDTTPVNYSAHFTGGNAALPIFFVATKLSSPAFGTTTSSTPSTGAKIAVPSTQAGYYYLSFILDDTTNATFPDSLSAATTIDYFQLNYHPNSTQRLRGGATFNANKPQSLDAP